MRVRGGTRGILTAIDAGWLDPLGAKLIDAPRRGPLIGSDAREMARREARRRKRYAKRLSRALGVPVLFASDGPAHDRTDPDRVDSDRDGLRRFLEG